MNIRNQMCKKLGHFPAMLLCCLLLIQQGVILDYFMVRHYTVVWWSFWVASDACVLGIFITAFVFSWRHYRGNREHHTRAGTLPLGYIAWFIYSTVLVAKVAVIFLHIAGTLEEKSFFGPNLCKIEIAVTAIVFMLLVLGHHDTLTDERKHYINELSSGVTLDMLDSVEFLEILFVNESRLLLPLIYDDIIISISCLNFMLPTICLVVLSKTNTGRKPLSKTVMSFYNLVYILLVDVPFFVMRMILWHAHDMEISVFAVKNIIMIYLRIKVIYENTKEKMDKRKNTTNGGEPNEMEEMELAERLNDVEDTTATNI